MFNGRKARNLGIIDCGLVGITPDPYNSFISFVDFHASCKKRLRRFITDKGSRGTWCAKCQVVVFREVRESKGPFLFDKIYTLMQLYGLGSYGDLRAFAMSILIEQINQSNERGEKVRLALIDEKERLLGIIKTHEAITDDQKVSGSTQLSPEIEDFLSSFLK